MGHMKKIVILLSVVAVSFALQADDGACSKDKAACDKSKAAACDKSKAGACEKVKVGTCNKSTAEAKGCCPAGKKAEEAAKQPAPSPKTTS